MTTARIAYIGNFEPPHSTENEFRKAFEALDVEVVQWQEQLFDWNPFHLDGFDMVLWTHTHSLAPPEVHDRCWAFLKACYARNVPTAGVHLDRWWGLRRQDQAMTEPFFRCEYLFTADGGHDKAWEHWGVNHHWMPPAISEFETMPGTRRERWTRDVAFVGGWDGYGHTEWRHRPMLIDRMRTWGTRFGWTVGLWPERGQPRITQSDLSDLIASTTVVIGDSCLYGLEETGRYWSDRVPETLGRGGLLIHPEVNGFAENGFLDGQTLLTFPLYDFEVLEAKVGEILQGIEDGDEAIPEVAIRGHSLVLDRHTYTHRARTILKEVV